MGKFIAFGLKGYAKTMAVVDCRIRTHGLTGRQEFQDCVANILAHCDGVWITKSEDGKWYEADGHNATYNSDGTILLSPCDVPEEGN